QRLIDKNKIKKIREFLVKKEETFFNNIIVGLPDKVRFENDKGDFFTIDNIGNYENCNLIIPDTINSICVIDGQHRIYAHYEGNENDKNEQKISELRKKLHLLVTGLIFPPNMKNIQRAQIQSEIFLDINSNSKPVPADVLLHIEMLKDPFSDIGLARRIIEKLNKNKVFLNRFELSPLDETKDNSKIKVASIVKFALRYLVTINPLDGKVSLYTYWDGDKLALKNMDSSALDEYIKFCAKQLSDYFSAIRKNFTDAWNDNNSKILSVTSINGFIIAYNRQLIKNGLQDFEFFDKCFKKFNIDFSKEEFRYTSSQYRKFSNIIIKEAFEMEDSINISEVAITMK
ncbi:MAG: DGQHR domain-containing protein, partial [Clostridiaceae bacterium]